MLSSQETISFNRKNVTKNLDRLKRLADVSFQPVATDRCNLYVYLREVYSYVLAWNKASRREQLRNHLAVIKGLEKPRPNVDGFHMVISETCPRSKKTISKLAIALSNAAKAKIPVANFEVFLTEIGGPTQLCVRRSKVRIHRTIETARKLRQPETVWDEWGTWA